MTTGTSDKNLIEKTGAAAVIAVTQTEEDAKKTKEQLANLEANSNIYFGLFFNLFRYLKLHGFP